MLILAAMIIATLAAMLALSADFDSWPLPPSFQREGRAFALAAITIFASCDGAA
jgi:hypothetical protein